MIRTFTVLLACSIVTASIPAYAETPSVAVEVDVSALPPGDVTERLEAHILEKQTRILTDTGLELADDADATIRTTVSRYGEGDVNYRALLELLRADATGAEVERTITCELCRDGEFVLRVSDEVAVLSERVLYGPTDEEGSEATDSPTEDPKSPVEDVEDPPPPTPDEPRPIGLMGGAGIASMVVGAGTMAAGIPLALVKNEIRPIPAGIERRNTRPTGIALATVGGVLLATGAALLAVDVLRRQKRRRVSFLPTVSPSMLTVSMGMRF